MTYKLMYQVPYGDTFLVRNELFMKAADAYDVLVSLGYHLYYTDGWSTTWKRRTNNNKEQTAYCHNLWPD